MVKICTCVSHDHNILGDNPDQVTFFSFVALGISSSYQTAEDCRKSNIYEYDSNDH